MHSPCPRKHDCLPLQLFCLICHEVLNIVYQYLRCNSSRELLTDLRAMYRDLKRTILLGFVLIRPDLKYTGQKDQ